MSVNSSNNHAGSAADPSPAQPWPRSMLGFFGGMLLLPVFVFVIVWIMLPSASPADAKGSTSGDQASTTTAGDAAPAEPASNQVSVVQVDAAVVHPDPFAAYWNQAPVHTVQVLPQTVTMPMLNTASIDAVHVQAVRDSSHIAWRVSWHDPNPDDQVESGRFTDAVAIQFPVVPNSNVMMGLGGGNVELLHWKAVWQRDINEGYQDVVDLHPNAYTGLYWFATGEHPFRIEEAFKDPRSRQWLIAWSAGNPMADFERTKPVEIAVAQGFGTLTTKPDDGRSNARGAWLWDTWAVVFTRSLTGGDAAETYQFTEDSDQQFAIAVWQGSDGNVGGRKHWSNWVPYEFAP